MANTNRDFETSAFSDNYPVVLRSLKAIYGKKMLEIEKKYRFDEYWQQALRASDIDAKPMVLLLGQFSVGKTSFIQFLLKRKFPGMRVGPEPTTDRFVAVMYGDEDQVVPGNALSVDPEAPFGQLNKFGSNFLNRFEASQCSAPILQNITLIDTPGVLAGEKQKLGRNYHFNEISEWFANRSDLILLLFDAHKLDISDEFREAIESLKGNDDKVRVVLNKADTLTTQQLMRVYGALMWSLGKVVKTPEVMRVYIGSFWDEPYHNQDMAKLFDQEADDLLQDLLSLPRNSAVRKVNELVKRARLLRAHMLIIGHLKSKMPLLFGKESTRDELIKNLANEFQEVAKLHKVSPGDFPSVQKMQENLKGKNFSDFESFNERCLLQINDVLHKDLPQLLKAIQPPREERESNPFAVETWIVDPATFSAYQEIFESLRPVSGNISANVARDVLMNTGIAVNNLRSIWEHCDFEKNGKLDLEEFALALYLSEQVKNGMDVPDQLPFQFIPPSKRTKFAPKSPTTR